MVCFIGSLLRFLRGFPCKLERTLFLLLLRLLLFVEITQLLLTGYIALFLQLFIITVKFLTEAAYTGVQALFLLPNHIHFLMAVWTAGIADEGEILLVFTGRIAAGQ